MCLHMQSSTSSHSEAAFVVHLQFLTCQELQITQITIVEMTKILGVLLLAVSGAFMNLWKCCNSQCGKGSKTCGCCNFTYFA